MKVEHDWLLWAVYRIIGSSNYRRLVFTCQGLAELVTVKYGLSGEAVATDKHIRSFIRAKKVGGDDAFSIPWRNGCWNPHPKKVKKENIIPIKGTKKKVMKGGNAVLVLGWTDGDISNCIVRVGNTKTARSRLSLSDEEKKRMAAGLAGSGGINQNDSTGTGGGEEKENTPPEANESVEKPAVYTVLLDPYVGDDGTIRFSIGDKIYSCDTNRLISISKKEPLPHASQADSECQASEDSTDEEGGSGNRKEYSLGVGVETVGGFDCTCPNGYIIKRKRRTMKIMIVGTI